MHSNRRSALFYKALIRAFAFGLLITSGLVTISSSPASGQEISRKVKNKVAPNYPELAQRMKIAGVVRVQVTVSQNGSIKEAKLVGGHPVLANAALDAVKQWRFEAGPEESVGIVEFHFDATR